MIDTIFTAIKNKNNLYQNITVKERGKYDSETCEEKLYFKWIYKIGK